MLSSDVHDEWDLFIFLCVYILCVDFQYLGGFPFSQIIHKSVLSSKQSVKYECPQTEPGTINLIFLQQHSEECILGNSVGIRKFGQKPVVVIWRAITKAFTDIQEYTGGFRNYLYTWCDHCREKEMRINPIILSWGNF